MKNPQKRKKHTFSKTLAALILVCAAITADSNLRLTAAEYQVESGRLPAAFDGFRIVSLSDLHGAEFGEGNRRLIRRVEKLEPDLIALTGDFVDGEAELEIFAALVGSLVQIAPVYFVSGNHDCASGVLDEAAAILNDCGAVYLQNEYLLLEREGESVVLAGVEDPNRWAEMTRPDELADIINGVYPDKYVVLLGHRNDWVDRYPGLQVDVVLCGHSHGGLVRLPFVGGVFGTDRALLPEYDAGAFFSGRYEMIVSRGLGNSVAPRFLNNPEIIVVTLRASK